MEYRDLYDKYRNLTGEKILKGEKIPVGLYYITVIVCIENNKNEYLLQLNKKYNKWSFTGGHPKSGESSLDGIITEIKEELGVSVLSNELELIKTIQTEDDFVDLYYLKKDIDISCIEKQDEEVLDVGWFKIDEINQLISDELFLESHIKMLKYFI